MFFGSDNQAPASERVLAALTDAYRTHAGAYGADDFTSRAVERLREVFETDLEAYFVGTGTAANTLALSTMVEPWEAIVCHHQSHVIVDESTGPALFTGGASLIPAAPTGLRLTPEELQAKLGRLPDEWPHNVRPRALSLTQANECGQVYTADELAALTDVARGAGLRVHLDGARFANAVAATGASPAQLSWQAGVDVLCLGATKDGAIGAEAVIFFDRSLAVDFPFRMKRTGHLVSKGRLFGAQFLAWLDDEHWLNLAADANGAADRLRAGIEAADGVRPAFPTQSNEIFAIVPTATFERLTAAGASLYPWSTAVLPADTTIDDDEMLVRLVTSFVTSEHEITAFLKLCENSHEETP